MAVLVIGKCNLQLPDLLLETDLGHPISGLPGMVSLSLNSSLILQFFIGYTSPKHNTQKYLESIHTLYHKYLSEFNNYSLLIHCHNWKSGIGKVLISDIIRITRPASIIEYYDKSTQIEQIMQENVSFLDGVYHKPDSLLSSSKVPEEKVSDFKAARSKQILKYFGVVGDSAVELAALKPSVSFFHDLCVRVDLEEIHESQARMIVGKIVGICKKASGECVGLGIIRDYNEENGMLYLITPVQMTEDADCLDAHSGDGCVMLEKPALWSEKLMESFEFDIPNVMGGVIMAEKLNKYHPSRNISK